MSDRIPPEHDQARSVPSDPLSATRVHSEHPESGKADVRRSLAFIAYAAFITTLAQDKVLGAYPLKFLLKNTFHLTRTQLSAFWFWAGFAWYLKPLSGLIADSFPIFGTRRRSYMIAASTLGGVCWLLFNIVPHNPRSFLYVDIALGVMMVFGSTIMGALLVEAGQRYGATGRVSALREMVMDACSLIAGPIGGWLSTRAFGLTTGICAGLLFSLAGCAIFMLRERPIARRNTRVWVDAGHSLKIIAASRTLWAAVFLLLLFFIAPGFSTPLLYLEQDKLHFSQILIGNLDAAGGASAMAGAFTYSLLIRRFSLRRMLTVGILINAAGALLFYFFRSEGTALAVIIVNAYFGTIGVLPLFDLATRSTPRGGEAMGYALMMSVRNLALFGSDYLGSWLIEHHLHIAIAGITIIDHAKFSFYQLIWLNSGSTLLALTAVPLLPRAVMSRREGEELSEPGITGEQFSAVEPGGGEE